MRELAPQGKDGSYVRPTYTSAGHIGDPGFPVGDQLRVKEGFCKCPLINSEPLATSVTRVGVPGWMAV